MPKQTEKLGDWRVFKTAEAVAVHAAEWLCSVACGRNGEIAICLSGGSTPRRLYQHILKCYLEYYNAVRTHLSLGKDAPICRDIQHAGRIEVRPVLGGLHHQYGRI